MNNNPLYLKHLTPDDTFSDFIEKINSNFESISFSNGGAKGERGRQGEQGSPGIPGIPGKKGEKGDNGDNGTTVIFKNTNPNEEDLNNLTIGSYVINITNSNIYRKDSVEFTFVGRLISESTSNESLLKKFEISNYNPDINVLSKKFTNESLILSNLYSNDNINPLSSPLNTVNEVFQYVIGKNTSNTAYSLAEYSLSIYNSDNSNIGKILHFANSKSIENIESWRDNGSGVSFNLLWNSSNIETLQLNGVKSGNLNHYHLLEFNFNKVHIKIPSNNFENAPLFSIGNYTDYIGSPSIKEAQSVFGGAVRFQNTSNLPDGFSYPNGTLFYKNNILYFRNDNNDKIIPFVDSNKTSFNNITLSAQNNDLIESIESSAVDNKINIKAGNNISLEFVNNQIIINSTGSGGGTSIPADLKFYESFHLKNGNDDAGTIYASSPRDRIYIEAAIGSGILLENSTQIVAGNTYKKIIIKKSLNNDSSNYQSAKITIGFNDLVDSESKKLDSFSSSEVLTSRLPVTSPPIIIPKYNRVDNITYNYYYNTLSIQQVLQGNNRHILVDSTTDKKILAHTLYGNRYVDYYDFPDTELSTIISNFNNVNLGVTETNKSIGFINLKDGLTKYRVTCTIYGIPYSGTSSSIMYGSYTPISVALSIRNRSTPVYKTPNARIIHSILNTHHIEPRPAIFGLSNSSSQQQYNSNLNNIYNNAIKAESSGIIELNKNEVCEILFMSIIQGSPGNGGTSGSTNNQNQWFSTDIKYANIYFELLG